MREFFIRYNWGLFEVWVKDPLNGSTYTIASETTFDGAIRRAADLNGGPLTLALTQGLV